MFAGAAGIEPAELQDHRSGGERSQPLCHDTLFGEQRSRFPPSAGAAKYSDSQKQTHARGRAHAPKPFLDMSY